MSSVGGPASEIAEGEEAVAAGPPVSESESVQQGEGGDQSFNGARSEIVEEDDEETTEGGGTESESASDSLVEYEGSGPVRASYADSRTLPEDRESAGEEADDEEDWVRAQVIPEDDSVVEPQAINPGLDKSDHDWFTEHIMAASGAEEARAIYDAKRLYNATRGASSDSDMQDVDLYPDAEPYQDTPHDHSDHSKPSQQNDGGGGFHEKAKTDKYNPFEEIDKIGSEQEAKDIEASEKEVKPPLPAELDWPPKSSLKNPILRVWLWFFLLIVPNLMIVSVSVIPLGDPNVLFDKHGCWPMIFFVNPLIMSVIGCVHFMLYIACVGGKNNLLAYAQIVVGIYFMQILVLVPLVYFLGFFRYIGVLSLCLTYLVTFASVWLHQQELLLGADSARWQYLYWRYIRIVFTLFVHLSFIVLYIWAFQASPGSVQPVLTFGLGIVTFINRKIVLGFSDPFPIELAMLVSGFFVNNMSDMFQTLAYPNVKNPVSYIYIWVINLFADAANLIFLTQPWFTFRVWIKGVLLCQCKHMPKQNDDDIPDERGHSPNRPGYMRRQARFYFWRIASKMCAYIFYLFISIVLRYGPNKQFYIFSEEPYGNPIDDEGNHLSTLSSSEYINSLAFVLFSFVFVMLAAAIGYILVRCRYRETYHQLKPVFRKTLRNRLYIAFVIAIVVHNGLLAILILQYHQKLWWARD